MCSNGDGSIFGMQFIWNLHKTEYAIINLAIFLMILFYIYDQQELSDWHVVNWTSVQTV